MSDEKKGLIELGWFGPMPPAEGSGGAVMCDSGDAGKKRYLLGPWEDPGDGPVALMSLECALDDLRSRYEEGEVGDELTYRVVELTDAEVEALPEL